MKRGISSALEERGIPHQMAGEGGMFNVYFTPDPVRNYMDVRRSDLRFRRFLDLQLITDGIYLKPENRYCLSLAHSEDDVSTAIKMFEQSVDDVISSVPS